MQQLKGELRNAAVENESLQHEVLRLQEQQFQKMVDPRYAPIEDSYIQHELAEVQSDISRIGKKYIARRVNWLKDKSTGEMDELYKELSNIVRFEDNAPSAIQAEIETERAIGRVLFTALLSWHVHAGVLANPFFFLTEKTSGTDWARSFLDIDIWAREGSLQQALGKLAWN